MLYYTVLLMHVTNEHKGFAAGLQTGGSQGQPGDCH